MKQIVPSGTTSIRSVIYVTNTNGTGVTGLTYNASGLTWYWYTNTNGTSSQVTLANQTLGTWTSGGFIQIDATNLPGFYELGVPNAVFGAGVTWAAMEIFGASGMLPVTVEFEVTPINVLGGTIATVTNTVTATVPTLSTNVNVQQWLGTAVTSAAGVPVVFTTGGTIATVTGTVAAVTTATSVGTVTSVTSATVVGTPTVNVVDWLGTAVTSSAGTPIVVATNTQPANVVQWLGTAVTSAAGVPVVFTTNTVTATVPSLSTNVNVTEWDGHAVATPNINGVPVVDVSDWLGTAVTSNAGVPLVDVNSITGTVTATVVGGTIATVTNPVSISTGQLTVKRNTSLNGFTFPMYDATSGNPATGLTVSCSRTIDGGALAGSANSPSEIGSGIYSLNLAASDLSGTVITLVFVASSASATIVTLITQE